jgi:limonene-1,2-epoxide hydrolase
MRPDEFPSLFTHGWTLPKPDAFLEYFLPLIFTDAVFVQPGFPDAKGHAQIAQMFRRLFTLFPNLSATPQCSAAAGHTVFIESECAATAGRRTVQFEVCDRFVIRDAKIVLRRSYSDPTAMIFALGRSPSSWPRIIKSRIG